MKRSFKFYILLYVFITFFSCGVGTAYAKDLQAYVAQVNNYEQELRANQERIKDLRRQTGTEQQQQNITKKIRQNSQNLEELVDELTALFDDAGEQDKIILFDLVERARQLLLKYWGELVEVRAKQEKATQIFMWISEKQPEVEALRRGRRQEQQQAGPVDQDLIPVLLHLWQSLQALTRLLATAEPEEEQEVRHVNIFEEFRDLPFRAELQKANSPEFLERHARETEKLIDLYDRLSPDDPQIAAQAEVVKRLEQEKNLGPRIDQTARELGKQYYLPGNLIWSKIISDAQQQVYRGPFGYQFMHHLQHLHNPLTYFISSRQIVSSCGYQSLANMLAVNTLSQEQDLMAIPTLSMTIRDQAENIFDRYIEEKITCAGDPFLEIAGLSTIITEMAEKRTAYENNPLVPQVDNIFLVEARGSTNTFVSTAFEAVTVTDPRSQEAERFKETNPQEYLRIKTRELTQADFNFVGSDDVRQQMVQSIRDNYLTHFLIVYAGGGESGHWVYTFVVNNNGRYDWFFLNSNHGVLTETSTEGFTMHVVDHLIEQAKQ